MTHPTRSRPAHHKADGGFCNPWPNAAPHGYRDLLRWVVERRRKTRSPNPPPGTFPLATPSFPSQPRAGELSATWIGHSTVLLQLEGVNVLTDPVFSDRASPVQFAGPRRVVPPAVALEALPAIDLVLISHNHYDHLDRASVERLAKRHPNAEWRTPLGLAALVRRWGAPRVRQLDWWEEETLTMRAGSRLRVGCTPSQHFSARGLGDRDRTLWCGWALVGREHRVFFAGDTGYHPEFTNIAERWGPFDIVMLPVGAYEPRWFMGPVHMNPEDAIRAYQDLTAVVPSNGRAPAMLPVHWGTFRLTDEAMEEPPMRTRQRWRVAGLEPEGLWLLAHGETRGMPKKGVRGRS